MSVKPVSEMSSVPKMPESQQKAKVTRVVEDKFPDGAAYRQPTRNTTVFHLHAIEETDETVESPPQASTFENLKPPAPNPRKGLALKKLAALKEEEARNKFK